MDVSRRWSHITTELGKKGIQVLTNTSDGDSKLLKAMKIESSIGTTIQNTNFNCEWLNCKMNINSPLCFEDFIHIRTKLRNIMLRSSAILPIGNGVVSKSFLKYLINTVSKYKHGLTDTDIEPQDRQNMKSTTKICDERTQHCLTKYRGGNDSGNWLHTLKGIAGESGK